MESRIPRLNIGERRTYQCADTGRETLVRVKVSFLPDEESSTNSITHNLVWGHNDITGNTITAAADADGERDLLRTKLCVRVVDQCCRQGRSNSTREDHGGETARRGNNSGKR